MTNPSHPERFLPSEIADLLNLSLKERVIFEVLGKAQIGMRASKIAKDTNMPLSTTAYVLRKLEKRKLVSKFQIASKRDFWRCVRQMKNGQLARKLGEKAAPRRQGRYFLRTEES